MRTSMKTVLVAAAVAAVLSLPALAANTSLFSSRIGDIVFPFGAPSSAGANGTIGDPTRGGMAPVNGNLSYVKSVPSTGFSLTFDTYQRQLLLKPAGTLAAGYVTMAPNPIDGTEACIFSTQIITALYVSANTGQTINDAVTTLAANAKVCYTYSLSNTTWDRSK